jgi:hypothetical protein
MAIETANTVGWGRSDCSKILDVCMRVKVLSVSLLFFERNQINACIDPVIVRTKPAYIIKII